MIPRKKGATHDWEKGWDGHSPKTPRSSFMTCWTFATTGEISLSQGELWSRMGGGNEETRKP